MAAASRADRAMPRARCGHDRAQRLWRFCLGASLLLHAALLWLPAGAPPAPSASRALPALTLTLKSPLPAPSSPAPSSPASVAARRARTVPRAGFAAPPVALSARPSLPSPSSAGSSSSASARVSVDDAPPPQLDVDGLRAQARELARGDRSRPPVAASDAPDGARLEALARRIGQPLAAASERRLADGSRMIRFAGNVCLHLPRHLPLGFENSLGPTVLPTTNCRD